jgi:hypothetical protein
MLNIACIAVLVLRVFATPPAEHKNLKKLYLELLRKNGFYPQSWQVSKKTHARRICHIEEPNKSFGSLRSLRMTIAARKDLKKEQCGRKLREEASSKQPEGSSKKQEEAYYVAFGG